MATRDWESWMWQQAQDLLSEAERIRWSFMESAAAARTDPLYGHPSWGPPLNVIETEEAFWVLASLPGVDGEEIEIRLEADFMVISGCRALPEGLKDGRPHVFEIPSGPFERRLRLPQGAKLQIGERTLARGILTIELRKLA